MTKMYVYQSPNRSVTRSWHDGGGILIITDRSPREAWEMYCADNDLPTKDGSYDEGKTVPPLSECGKRDLVNGEWVTETFEPEGIKLASSQPERVIVFPNAGCC